MFLRFAGAYHFVPTRFLLVQQDVGASDAADWAIARSLSALRAAEQKGDLTKDKKPSAEGTHEEGEDEDDESV